jgi:hypothetical protein
MQAYFFDEMESDYIKSFTLPEFSDRSDDIDRDQSIEQYIASIREFYDSYGFIGVISLSDDIFML